ncbi:hypothetical protein AQUCO_00400766v1 [Aquilegia coerulea]|uniref:Peptidase A1 domain-containing protein n=1 Tax=Aquilegia coerulea TaxID=218851 RepID=A0A2G5EWH9_AQUCA|nr:hypothetical protein AQUCO_00400766v1 [Aquilegia coerulea]
MALNKFVLCSYYFLVLLLIQSVIANCNGFSLKLIHMDSKESPHYPGNLTIEERVERLCKQTDARLNYYVAKMNQFGNLQPEMVRSRISFQGSYYLAKIGLGTFDHSPQQPSYRNYNLIVDTGSELTWTQCEPCKGFNQTQPVFPVEKSKSYRWLGCNSHSLCYRDVCQHDLCSYKIKYVTNQSSEGYLGIDKFTFELDNGATEIVDGLVFGCGHIQKDFKFITTPNQVNGILGMGTGPRSLINQLGNRAQGRFSYCIPRWKEDGDASNIFLRFGNEAKFRQGGLPAHTVPFTVEKAKPTYYIKLLDISVAGNRFHFPPGYFDLRQDGTGRGGCFIDSGTPLSVLPQDAYMRVRNAVASFWAQQQLPVKQKPDQDHLLCYEIPRPGQRFPLIIFHFLNVDFTIQAGAFLHAGDAICLAFKPSHNNSGISIIGGLAQSNYRFLFDLAAKTVSFAQEECKKYP